MTNFLRPLIALSMLASATVAPAMADINPVSPIASADHANAYAGLNYVLKIEGKTVAGFESVSGVDRGAVTLQNGVTFDETFNKWAIYPSKANPRRQAMLERIDGTGATVETIPLSNAFPDRYTVYTKLTDAGAVEIASLILRTGA